MNFSEKKLFEGSLLKTKIHKIAQILWFLVSNRKGFPSDFYHAFKLLLLIFHKFVGNLFGTGGRCHHRLFKYLRITFQSIYLLNQILRQLRRKNVFGIVEPVIKTICAIFRNL